MEDSKLKFYLLFARDVLNTFGLPTIILTIFFLLWTGTIASPLSEAGLTISHIRETLDKHLERDKQIIFYMRSMCLSNAKLAHTSEHDCLWEHDEP